MPCPDRHRTARPGLTQTPNTSGQAGNQHERSKRHEAAQLFRAAYGRGASIRALAADSGRSYSSVRALLAEAGTRFRSRGRYSSGAKQKGGDR